VFCILVVLVRLSVPVQVTDWKDSSPKRTTVCDAYVKPYSFTRCYTNRLQEKINSCRKTRKRFR